jgi:hypothetical protein
MTRYRSGEVKPKNQGVKSIESFKSYDLRQASTVTEVNLQEFVPTWQLLAGGFFGFFSCLVFLSINDHKYIKWRAHSSDLISNESGQIG